MDYSLLLAIHNLEKDSKLNNSQLEAYYESRINEQLHEQQQQQQQQAATFNANSITANIGAHFKGTNYTPIKQPEHVFNVYV
jgi:hypothetical protein